MTDDDKVAKTEFEILLDRFHALSVGERLELAVALLNRESVSRRDSSIAFLRKQFPQAADEMLHSLAFHAYWETPDNMRDLMAWVELRLRDGQHERHLGLIWNVLFNLYNWLQTEALLPYGCQDVFDELREVQACLETDDKEGALVTLRKLLERFEGATSPPHFDGETG